LSCPSASQVCSNSGSGANHGVNCAAVAPSRRDIGDGIIQEKDAGTAVQGGPCDYSQDTSVCIGFSDYAKCSVSGSWILNNCNNGTKCESQVNGFTQSVACIPYSSTIKQLLPPISLGPCSSADSSWQVCSENSLGYWTCDAKAGEWSYYKACGANTKCTLVDSTGSPYSQAVDCI
jgi:hypothetical protein